MNRKILFVASEESQRASKGVLRFVRKLGRWLAQVDHVPMTGNTPGAERVFACGASDVRPESVTCYLPYAGYGGPVFPGNRYVLVFPDERHRESDPDRAAAADEALRAAEIHFPVHAPANPPGRPGRAVAERTAIELLDLHRGVEELPWSERGKKVAEVKSWLEEHLVLDGRDENGGEYFEVPLPPRWDDLKEGGQKTIARYVPAIELADVVIALPDDTPSGGTGGFAIRLGRKLGKVVIDLRRAAPEMLRFYLCGLPSLEAADMEAELLWLARRSGGVVWVPESERLSLSRYRELQAAALQNGRRRKGQKRLADALWNELAGRDPLPDPAEDAWSVQATEVEREREDDPEAPETELRAVFGHRKGDRRYVCGGQLDMGSPVTDKFAGIAALHGGQRLFAESAFATPSGVVLAERPVERSQDGSLYALRRASWELFRKSFEDLEAGLRKRLIMLRDAIDALDVGQETQEQLLEQLVGDVEREKNLEKALRRCSRFGRTASDGDLRDLAARRVLGDAVAHYAALAADLDPARAKHIEKRLSEEFLRWLWETRSRIKRASAQALLGIELALKAQWEDDPHGREYLSREIRERRRELRALPDDELGSLDGSRTGLDELQWRLVLDRAHRLFEADGTSSIVEDEPEAETIEGNAEEADVAETDDGTGFEVELAGVEEQDAQEVELPVGGQPPQVIVAQPAPRAYQVVSAGMTGPIVGSFSLVRKLERVPLGAQGKVALWNWEDAPRPTRWIPEGTTAREPWQPTWKPRHAELFERARAAGTLKELEGLVKDVLAVPGAEGKALVAECQLREAHLEQEPARRTALLAQRIVTATTEWSLEKLRNEVGGSAYLRALMESRLARVRNGEVVEEVQEKDPGVVLSVKPYEIVEPLYARERRERQERRKTSATPGQVVFARMRARKVAAPLVA